MTPHPLPHSIDISTYKITVIPHPKQKLIDLSPIYTATKTTTSPADKKQGEK